MNKLASLIALVVAGPAVCSAAEGLPPQFAACATLSRDSERLACYDKAVTLLEAGGEAAPPPSAENMFGASTSLANTAPRKSETEREELRQITGTITSLRHVEGGMISIDLDNGQTWRQQDSDVSLAMKQGDSVTVVRASMGTFRIADKRGRSARFKRVR
jgi:hypothetical protein